LAGPRNAGFSAKRATITGSELLRDPKIQTAIQDSLTDHLRGLHVDAEMVIAGIVETIEAAKNATYCSRRRDRRLRG
jgi:phage terminase small subunit